MRSIALMGRAGAGKDTAAAELVERDGYTRVAFADPLKAMALAVDPYVAGWAFRVNTVPTLYRLSDVVDDIGWTRAKDEVPEVRRFLQRLGLEGVRGILGDDTWLNLALREVENTHAAGRPVVVTDVRFRNELDELRKLGFVAVWIDRPGLRDGEHASEAELGPWDADGAVMNGGTAEDLYELVMAASGNM